MQPVRNYYASGDSKSISGMEFRQWEDGDERLDPNILTTPCEEAMKADLNRLLDAVKKRTGCLKSLRPVDNLSKKTNATSFEPDSTYSSENNKSISRGHRPTGKSFEPFIDNQTRETAPMVPGARPFEDLPMDILYQIALGLDIESIRNLAKSSQRLYDIQVSPAPIWPVYVLCGQPLEKDICYQCGFIPFTKNRHRFGCWVDTVFSLLSDENGHIETSKLCSGLWSSALQFIRSTKPIVELTAIRVLLAMIPRVVAPPPWGDLETLHLQDLAYAEGRRILWEGLYLAVARFAGWLLRRRQIPEGVRNKAAEMLITVLSNAGCMFMAAVSAMLAISYSRLLAGDHSFKPWYVAQIEGGLSC
jgi:hypothetical protein